MRLLYFAAALSFGLSSLAAGDLSIAKYRLIGTERVSLTQVSATYAASLTNSGPAEAAVSATLTQQGPGIRVVAEKDTLTFAPVPANSEVASGNTFTIIVDRSLLIDFSRLQWQFRTNPAPPVANAGANQTAPVGAIVTLNGSGSTNPGGGVLTYNFAFASLPPNSNAILVNAASLMPTFVVDAPGSYAIKLTVSNGSASDTALVTVTTVNTPPVANAGPNQTVAVGATVTLNGSGSSDVDGNPLTYSYSLLAKPAGSSAALSGPNTISPSFIADKAGSYIAQLIANDGVANSNPSTVTITTRNTPPVANAGASQAVDVGATVQLNGAGSTDVDGDALTYQWSLTTVPSGSAAALSNPTAVVAGFTVDRPGAYVAQLVVNDGRAASVPATVAITTNMVQAPTANAGPNQTVAVNTLVALGGGGVDPQSLPLTFHWSLVAKPSGSAAALSGSLTPNPVFTADKAGSYVAQLIVNNGVLDSAPSSVAIATTVTPPRAIAGSDQTVAAGSTAVLDGSGSSDSGKSPLTYSWSLLSRPSGSVAAVTPSNGVAPSLATDLAGIYVVQLIVGNGVANSVPSTLSITAVDGSPASIVVSAGSPQTARTQAVFALPLTATVKNAAGKPVIGVTVTFTAPSGGAGGMFAGGIDTAVSDAAGVATSAAFTANATSGAYIVTASAAGLSSLAVFSLANTAAPPASIVAGGTPPSALVNTAFSTPLVAVVRDVNGNPVSGVTVIFTPPATGPSGIFSGGVTTAVTDSAGVARSAPFTANSAPGNYTVAASTAGVVAPATFALTNTANADSGGLTVSGTSVGQSLQTAVTIALAQPAPAGGVHITVTSSDPASLVVAARPSDLGAASAILGVGTGSDSVIVYVQGIGSSGTAYLTASAPGIGSGTSSIALTPSGFVLAGPNGLGIPSFSTGIGVKTTITVMSARLDASLNFVESQPLRAGVSVNVPVVSSAPSQGACTPAQVVFVGGQNSAAAVQFSPSAAGDATLTAVVPNGFNTPAANANLLTASVAPSGLIPGNVTVGRNLETTASVTLNGAAPAGGLAVLLTSGDPSKALLSAAPDGAGSASLSLTVPAGLNHTQEFYVQALTGNGTVVYTATAPGFGSANGTVTLTPSGIVLAGPYGLGVPSFTAAAGGQSSALTIYAAQLDPLTGNFAAVQQLRGGTSAAVNVSSSNLSTGTIATSPLTIAGGAFSAASSFLPGSSGSSNLSVDVPTGFTAPAQDATVVANVVTPGIGVTDQVLIGFNLQTSATLVLAEPAPPGGLAVTLTSNDPKLFLSGSATAAGSGSLTVLVPEGSNNASYYLQALASSGSATYSGAAPGYRVSTGTVRFGPSGVVLAGPYGIGFLFPVSTTAAAGPMRLAVYPALLDANGGFLETQQVAGGLSLTVALTSSSAATGAVTSPVTIAGGSDNALAQFTPRAAGYTTLSVLTPAGYKSPPATYAAVTVNVQ